MALTSDESTALDTLTDDIAEVAARLYSELLGKRVAQPGYGKPERFTSEQAFELTKILLVYAVNGTEES